MTDIGIIFSPPMVQSLICDHKTQTRRLATSPLRRAQPGDRLWVRETFGLWSTGHDCELTFAGGATRATGPNSGEIPDASLPGYFKMVDRSVKAEKRINIPAIHMPRWASRITLLVEDVRFQRLQEIDEKDAEAEGCVWDSADGFDVWYVPFGARLPHTATAAECYRGLWESLHTDNGQRWQDNPKVLALTFRVVKQNIDRIST